MNEVELAALLSFVEVVKNFLGKYRADNYKKLQTIWLESSEFLVLA